MPGFGRFETYDEVAPRRGPLEVWRARPAGTEGEGPFVIKSFRTDDDIADPEVVERQVGRFLSAAKLQQSLAKAGPGWATIHEANRTTTHGYYVTDWFPWSVQRLVDARREVTAPGIVHLCARVLDALEAIQKAANGRGHGNLKPGNILVRPKDAQTADLEGATVCLADPAPDGTLRGDAQAEDLRALADIMHMLVTGREAPEAGAVQGGPGWSAMGAPGPGEELRKVCEFMLNPHAGQPVASPQELRERLAVCLKAKSAKKKSRMPLVLAGGGLVAALVVGGVLYFKGRGITPVDLAKEPRTPTPAQWHEERRAALDGVSATLNELTRAVVWSTDTSHLERHAAFKERLAALQQEEGELAAQSWPEGTAEGVEAARGALRAQIDNFEQARLALSREVTAFDAMVPKPKAEEDKRGPNPSAWKQAEKEQMSAAVEGARVELAGEATPEALETLRTLNEREQSITQRLVTLQAETWPKDESQDPAALQAVKQARERIEAEAVSIAGELQKLGADAEQMRRKSRQGIANYLRQQRSTDVRNGLVSSSLLREAYADAMDKIEPDKVTWVQAKERVEGVQDWLKKLEKDVGAEFQYTKAGDSRVNPKVVADLLTAELGTTLETLVKPLRDTGEPPAGDQDAAMRAQAKARLGGVADRAKVVLGLAERIEANLRAARGYHEAPAGGKSIAALEAELRAAPDFGRLEAAVRDVLADAVALGEASKLADVGAVRRAIDALPGAGVWDASRAITLWRTLVQDGFPKLAADVPTAPGTASVVKAVLRAAPDKARADELIAEVDRDLKTGWFAFVHERANGDPASVNAAFTTYETFGVSDSDLKDGLQDFARFNLLRWRLIPAVEAARGAGNAKAQGEALQPIVTGFRDAALRLPGVASRGDVQEFFGKKLKDFIDNKHMDFGSVGPAQEGNAVRWTVADKDEENATWVEYQFGRHKLVFRRVGAGDESGSYVCTTEVPVGLFRDSITSAKGWPDLANDRVAMLYSGSRDNRRGVRVWDWNERGNQFIVRSNADAGRGWLNPGLALRNVTNLYPPDVAPEPPTDRTPVNYVTVAGAAYFAGIMGCRFPTEAEWRQAAGEDKGTPNLRDSNWTKVYSYLSVLTTPSGGNIPSSNVPWLANEVFSPPREGEEAVKPPAADNQGDGTDADLFFRGVPEGSREFRDLVGNVAEFVFAGAAAPSDPPQGGGVLQQVFDRIKPADVRVIGASGLSGERVKANVAYPISNTLGARASDVGLRLAFSASGGGGGGRPADKLVALLSTTPYLTKTTPN